MRLDITLRSQSESSQHVAPIRRANGYILVAVFMISVLTWQFHELHKHDNVVSSPRHVKVNHVRPNQCNKMRDRR
jgi:hypothetical protein